MNTAQGRTAADTAMDLPKTCYAFTDGSVSYENPDVMSKENIPVCVSYGGFLIDADGVEHELKDAVGVGDDDDDIANRKLRNVAGEIMGAEAAIKKAQELKLKELTILYDFEGVGSWVTPKPDGKPGETVWKPRMKRSRDYAGFVAEARETMTIRFIQVPGHSGIPGNEKADRLAKQAAQEFRERKATMKRETR